MRRCYLWLLFVGFVQPAFAPVGTRQTRHVVRRFRKARETTKPFAREEVEMVAQARLATLDHEGLQRFLALQAEAADLLAGDCPDAPNALREDIVSCLHVLRPVLEFGLAQPMVEHLAWLRSVWLARSIPVDGLAASLERLEAFFIERMEGEDGCIVAAALAAAQTAFRRAACTPQAREAAAECRCELTAFLNALLEGRRKEAFAVADRWFAEGRSLVELEQHVIAPALCRIGDMWQLNQVSVAQEHMATAIAQSVMTGGLLRSPAPAMTARKILLACVEGNSHAIGLSMVSDAFQLAGWDVDYLGANTPTSALVEHVVASAPDLVGLSASFPPHLCLVRAIVAELDRRLGALRPRVIVGGLAANQFASLAAEADADAFIPTASAAVALGNELVEAKALA